MKLQRLSCKPSSKAYKSFFTLHIISAHLGGLSTYRSIHPSVGPPARPPVHWVIQSPQHQLPLHAPAIIRLEHKKRSEIQTTFKRREMLMMENFPLFLFFYGWGGQKARPRVIHHFHSNCPSIGHLCNQRPIRPRVRLGCLCPVSASRHRQIRLSLTTLTPTRAHPSCPE